MATLDIAKYRKRLVSERERLVADHHRVSPVDEEGIAQQVGELANSDSNHPGDYGTETFERAKDVALEANIEALIAQVDDALAKMDNGTYGTCDRCGRPIGTERLNAVPYASFCVDCQNIVENQ